MPTTTAQPEYIARNLARLDLRRGAFEAQQGKLDYFVTGMAGVLTAYLGENLALGPIGLNASTIALASVLCLAACTLVSLDRLRWIVRQSRQSYTWMLETATLDAINNADDEGVSHPVTGEFITSAEATTQMLAAWERRKKADAQVVRAAAISRYLQRARTALLYAGLVLLATSKLLSAIELARSAPALP